MIRIQLPLLAALLFAASAAQAQPPIPPTMPMEAGPGRYGPPPSRPMTMAPPARTMSASPTREAAATVSAGLEKLFAFVRESDTPQNKLQTAAFLDREIAPYFDFGYMAQFVAGAKWGQLTDAQRTALAAQLEARILGGLAQQLIGYGGQEVRFVRPRRAKGGVDVQIGLSTRGNRYPTRLVFRMYETGGDWRVFDVIAEGRSLLAYYRGAFEQLIREQ
jgi:phospholipid transport system substrate-binding protein